VCTTNIQCVLTCPDMSPAPCLLQQLTGQAPDKSPQGSTACRRHGPTGQGWWSASSPHQSAGTGSTAAQVHQAPAARTTWQSSKAQDKPAQALTKSRGCMRPGPLIAKAANGIYILHTYREKNCLVSSEAYACCEAPFGMLSQQGSAASCCCSRSSAAGCHAEQNGRAAEASAALLGLCCQRVL
jgi:hypothetical protein